MTFSWPSECTSLSSWFYWDWDSRDHWENPYILWRKHGIRIFGIEFEGLYKEKVF